MLPEDAEIVANVRQLSGIRGPEGPNDQHLAAGVRGFVEAFDYWYIRVIREAVPKYRDLIIKRINPFIRRIEFEGQSVGACADRLVEDYNSRNFVTAGGWALEELAVRAGADSQKSSAEGIDLQRTDPDTGEYHLYVLKSGLVTRNSDIVNALKRNARQAEKLLRQGRATFKVYANYAILAGKTQSTFEDGVRRPSSAEFWGEILGLPDDQAIDLALAMAAEAGRLVRRDAAEHIDAMKLLIRIYLDYPERSGEVDWEFIVTRNMRPPTIWRAEDRRRHKRALELLDSTGYQIQTKRDRQAAAIAEAVAEASQTTMKDSAAPTSSVSRTDADEESVVQ